MNENWQFLHFQFELLRRTFCGYLCLQNITGTFVLNLIDVNDFWAYVILMEIPRPIIQVYFFIGWDIMSQGLWIWRPEGWNKIKPHVISISKELESFNKHHNQFHAFIIFPRQF